MFLSGNFVALPWFKERYGVEIGLNAAGVMEYAIPTKWQSSLFQAGQCGAFVGVLLAGPVTNRLGYRWTTLLALFLMNSTIFITFFVSFAAIDVMNVMLTVPRPTLSRSLSSDKHSRAFHGVSSSPIRQHMLVRLFLWL